MESRDNRDSIEIIDIVNFLHLLIPRFPYIHSPCHMHPSIRSRVYRLEGTLVTAPATSSSLLSTPSPPSPSPSRLIFFLLSSQAPPHSSPSRRSHAPGPVFPSPLAPSPPQKSLRMLLFPASHLPSTFSPAQNLTSISPHPRPNPARPRMRAEEA